MLNRESVKRSFPMQDTGACENEKSKTKKETKRRKAFARFLLFSFDFLFPGSSIQRIPSHNI